nr:soluble scavenger receptor cysteine-rich domain-containing protein SSC5D-like isoform X1 [Pogona vitticeps]
MQRSFFFLAIFMSLHTTAGSFPVRLIGGPNLCVGRVELFHQGKWGTVCDDDWDMQDAAVVCRELDCGEALSAPHGAWFGEGAGPIWLNEVRCVGTEWHLHSCRHLGFRRHVCTHEEDASVICSEQRFPPFTAAPPPTAFRRGQLEEVTETGPHLSPTPAEGSPSLRLVGGRSHCSGRLEIFHEGQWGTVCDDMWDLLDVAVVCRELDCGEALAAPGGAFFGEGNSVIWLDDVQCQGEEATLAECHTSPWGTNNCRHSEDAGAVCSGEMPLAMVEEHMAMLSRTVAPQRSRSLAPKRIPRPVRPTRGQEEPVANEVSHTQESPKGHASEEILGGQWRVRLVGGPGSCAGRVEVLYKDRWGTVCDDGWDLVDAAVVCRELGCGAPLLSPGNARYGPGSGPIWLDDVNCTGSEFTLRRCRSQPWGKHNCNHHEDASVICTGKWKRLSLLKPTSDSNIARSTTITTTTQSTRSVEKLGLHITLHAFEATTATQSFPDEWEMESFHPTYPTEPLIATQNVELEQEKNRKLINSMDIVETTINPVIQQHIEEIESTTPPNTRVITHKSMQNPTYPSVEFQPSSAVWNLESENEIETATQEDMDKTVLNPEIIENVQDVESSSFPKTSILPHIGEQNPTSHSVTFLHPLSIGDLESERKNETTNSLGTEHPTTPAPEMMVPTSHARTTTYTYTGEQEPIHLSVKSQSSSTTKDLESKSVTETTIHWDMDKIIPNTEMLEMVQETASTSSTKTRAASHRREQKPTSTSIESLLSLDRGNLEFERENETVSPSGTEHPTATQGLKSVTDVVPSLHGDHTAEGPSVTQNTEPINSSDENQPTIAGWLQEPEGELETTTNVANEFVLFSNSLGVKLGVDLATTTEKEQSRDRLETVNPQIFNSEENTSQRQQEAQNIDLQTVKPMASAFVLNTLSTLDATDVHKTTDLPQRPVSHAAAIGELLQDGLVSSGDSENGMSYPDATSAPDLTEAPGPNISSVEAVTHHPKPSKASPGCPIKHEPVEEDQGCGCSSPALGKLAHAMEGLHGELGSLSSAIHHQGFQLEAVARSLAELAASVHHLVKILPILVQPAPAQSSSASFTQDEDLLLNQLPLK